MTSVKKLSLIRLLMIISQLVLILFVAQWLGSVYVKERNRMDQDFSRRFREAGMTMLDSLLVVKVLNPMMNDHAYRRLTMDISLDSLSGEMPGWKQQRDAEAGGTDSCRQVIAISASDSFTMPDRKVSARYLTLNSNDQIFLQGMKLVVQRIEDTLSMAGGSLKETVLLQDTGKLKQIFSGMIRDWNPAIRITWTTDTPPWKTKQSNPGRFYYEFPSNGYALGASITNPFPVIFREIFPSFLFALALLLLTGLSFVIAFRSLKSQIQLNRIRSDFMSNITHELKTPVSTVQVALEALKRFNPQNDPATVAEYLDMASREMNRLEKLITQVLNSSLYENGIQFVETEPVDPVRVANDVVSGLRYRIGELGASVQIHAPGDAGTVMADKLHLQGVLVNLIENSLNYGGKHPEIIITVERSECDVTLTVADNGPGIPEEFLGKVFEKFFRVPDGDRHNVKGYGLGLSYAAMVMQLHGGTIRAENIRGGGVRFIIFFPRKP